MEVVSSRIKVFLSSEVPIVWWLWKVSPVLYPLLVEILENCSFQSILRFRRKSLTNEYWLLNLPGNMILILITLNKNILAYCLMNWAKSILHQSFHELVINLARSRDICWSWKKACKMSLPSLDREVSNFHKTLLHCIFSAKEDMRNQKCC